MKDLIKFLSAIMGGFPNETSDFSIGIVVQPGQRGMFNQGLALTVAPITIANLWGHTAIYVRIKGRIVRAIGFDPHRIRMFDLSIGNKVSSGEISTTGYFYDEMSMFSSPNVMSVEFNVSAKEAIDFSKIMDGFKVGLALDTGKKLMSYCTSSKAGGYGNCIKWVKEVMQIAGFNLEYDIGVLESIKGLRWDAPKIKGLWDTNRQGLMSVAVKHNALVLRRGLDETVPRTMITHPYFYQIYRMTTGVGRSAYLFKIIWNVAEDVIFWTNPLATNKSWYQILIIDIATIVFWLYDFLDEVLPSGIKPKGWLSYIIEKLIRGFATAAYMYSWCKNDRTAWYFLIPQFIFMATLIISNLVKPGGKKKAIKMD